MRCRVRLVSSASERLERASHVGMRHMPGVGDKPEKIEIYPSRVLFMVEVSRPGLLRQLWIFAQALV
jgi:hypothetical protein